ncbi:MAG: magnesium transporter MgtE, partial [Actinobacteria bacterium]|nr:magnesium transporter MgtE [Actinomycetota bacterium]
MLLLSRLLHRPVRDAGGERIATLEDLVGTWQLDHLLVVAGLVARVGSRQFFVPWHQVAGLNQDVVDLSSYQFNFQRFERRPGEILLAGDIMDRRMVDVRRRRVIRVNDVALSWHEDRLFVEAVDVGFAALLRRLVPRAISPTFSGTALINWSDVEWLPSEAAVESPRFPLLARLHPVEVAHIVNELPPRQGADIVESLEDEDAAEVLSEVSEEHQAGVLLNLDEERAADILEAMEPDDAADLLHRMEDEDARDVQALMEYKEGTAGGLMTSHFVAVHQNLSAGESIALLRRMEDRPETVTHLLVVEAEGNGRLVGMAGLLDVVVASPEEPLSEIV